MNLENPPIYQDKFKVHTYEIDHTGHATLVSIQQFLQEVAVEHAMELKVSMYELFPQKLTWVLSRLHIIVERYPELHETVTVKTWPSGRHSAIATREFEMFDTHESKICMATTSWILIHLETKRPARINLMLPNLPVHPVRAVEDRFPKLPKLSIATNEKKFYVRFSDLDLNQHVNNISYLAWCLEAIPLEYWKKHELREIEVDFRAESFYGDIINSQCAPSSESNEIFYHRLTRSADQKELARGLTRWRPIK